MTENNGSGFGFFRRTRFPWIQRPMLCEDIIVIGDHWIRSSAKLESKQTFQNGWPHILCATALLPIYWKMAMISGRYRSFWGIRMWEQPWSIHMWQIWANSASRVHWTQHNYFLYFWIRFIIPIIVRKRMLTNMIRWVDITAIMLISRGIVIFLNFPGLSFKMRK